MEGNLEVAHDEEMEAKALAKLEQDKEAKEESINERENV